MSQEEAYNQLALYTLTLRDPLFIHQYIVDAYAAQNANEKTKPIALAFALIGLYLHLEKNYSGREVQLAHMKLGKTKRIWPKFDFPEERGEITVFDALKSKEGKERDEMINEWSRSVWRAWSGSHKKIEKFVQPELNLFS